MDADSILGAIFNFDNYGELLVLVQNSIWAGAILGLLGGLVGTFVMKRNLAFAVHGISELSFAGPPSPCWLARTWYLARSSDRWRLPFCWA